ncbi:hypothetical protein SASPL_143537 [Salvia splendens]|uniref:Uncharacterized protein n=1 Tax=Salvia splendens TaxID=180675 RepID=A0A8X8WMT8_SALSN|nr:hypothetical protein SASPL_143537 [Salvia splendens]
MFRALSVRRQGYEQLGEGDEPSPSASLMPKLSRTTSVPTKVMNSPKRVPTAAQEANKASKVHPFFSMFETKRRKKATMKPEFSRYLEYLKEGGAWDMAANKPVMYYK